MEQHESVYALIPQEPPRIEKPPLYKSIHHGQVQPFSKTSKEHLGGGAGDFKTMGKIVGRPHPDRFLKKFTRTAPLPAPKEQSYERKSTIQKRPPIPKKDERPVMGLVSQKNYITSNAVDNILAVPKRPQNTEVNYLKKADFGRVPAYLERVKAQVDEEYRMIAEMQEQQKPEEDKLLLMTDDERAAIVNGLKANWERINKEYQTLSFTLDTPAKKKRKEEYEAALEQIELDIKKLSRKFVFIHEQQEW